LEHDAEVAKENVPAEHAVQLPAPDEDLYSPALQFRHVVLPASGWYWPAEQFVHPCAPPPEKLPTGQAAQLCLLETSVYCPATQASHFEVPPAEASKLPGAQAVHDCALAGEMNPAAQLVHIFALAPLYFPALHASHEPFALFAWN